ncbi:hypothetical protein [Methylobacter sp. sgz302048]|uniref:hypothetical protein n=1 Tax=Methylobacter sp. sgz302048 TaxID=3455945 RepID=UPI003FA0F45D
MLTSSASSQLARLLALIRALKLYLEITKQKSPYQGSPIRKPLFKRLSVIWLLPEYLNIIQMAVNFWTTAQDP